MIKKRFISMLVLLAAVVTGAWADGIVCTASDLGKVLCTDGSIYENVSAATTAGKSPAAVIAYVDETNKNGLAIALADEGSMNWSTAMSTCDAKTAITGAKWCLPSQDQWKQMFAANGGNEGSCAGLNATITTAGGYALQVEFAFYWSSSEFNPGVYAYYVLLIDGDADWDYGSEDSGNSHLVRACLAFDIAAPAPATYKVSVKEGTEDATNWTITPAEATTTGVAAGTEVTATYGGTKKVKSVRAVKKAKPAATVTTAPTAKTGVKAGEDVAIVNEGAAEGGTMMYMVNATQPASTDGFSATVPTAEGLTAGTYYVWYYVKADDSHTDSEIAGPVTVTVKIAELSETITFSGGSQQYTYQGTHFSVSGKADMMEGYLSVNKFFNMTIAATDGKTITKVVFNYRTKANLGNLTFSSGNFDGDSTVDNVNATTLTVGSDITSSTNFSGVTIYYSE